MVSRRRIDGQSALSLVERGKTAIGKKLLRRVVKTPWDGVRVVLAYTRVSDFYREVNKVKAAMMEEIPRLAEASASAADYNAGMGQAAEAVSRLADPSAIERMASVKVLSDRILALYDPAISTEDDPAVTLGFLVKIGVPLAPEDYAANRADDEVVVTPSLIAAVLAASDSFYNLCLNQSLDLAAFYENKLEAELKNSAPSLDTVSPEGSNAAIAGTGGSTSLPQQPSGGSTNPQEGKSSTDGPANS